MAAGAAGGGAAGGLAVAKVKVNVPEWRARRAGKPTARALVLEALAGGERLTSTELHERLPGATWAAVGTACSLLARQGALHREPTGEVSVFGTMPYRYWLPKDPE